MPLPVKPTPVPRPTCVRVDVPLPMPADLGRRLEAAGLYSVGGDFTNGHVKLDPNYEGTSHLRHVYRGQPSLLKGRQWTHAAVWELRLSGASIGVILWEHSSEAPQWIPHEENRHSRPASQQFQAQRLGHVSVFLKKEHRGRGWMKAAVRKTVARELTKLADAAYPAGILPYVLASDATRALLEATSDVPILKRNLYSLMCEEQRRQRPRVFPSANPAHRPRKTSPSDVIDCPRLEKGARIRFARS